MVYHHGKSASGGHYTVAVRQANNNWIHIDDTRIESIAANEVAVSAGSGRGREDGNDKGAYLLLYNLIRL